MSENYIEKIQYGDTEYNIRDFRLLSDENNQIKIGGNITLNSEINSETNLPFGDITVGNLKLESIERPSSISNTFVGDGFELSSRFDDSAKEKKAALTLKKEESPDNSEEYIPTNSITLSYNGITSTQNNIALDAPNVNITQGVLSLGNYQIKIVEGNTTNDILSPEENTLYILVPPTETEGTE